MILENPVQEKLELQCNWPLNHDSVVVIAGAYTGTVAQDYWDRYQCHLYLYEPQAWAYGHLIARFANKKIHTYNCGLGIKDHVATGRNFGTDGFSFVNVDSSSPKRVDCHLLDAAKALPPKIDLFVCNMEGYEDLLLPYLAEKNVLQNIRFILCQIHNGNFQPLCDVMNVTHNGCEWLPGNWVIWERR